jgi:hypothetical protein
MSDLRRRDRDPAARDGASPDLPSRPHDRKREISMLWLIVGIILLIVAIAGGAIVHPILFAIGILALVAFFAGSRGRAGL